MAKRLRRHRDRLRALLPVLFKLPEETITDPDLMLYRGGFFSAADLARLTGTNCISYAVLRPFRTVWTFWWH